MRKILVPIDGSESSIHALAHVAARQRRGEKLSVIVLHAVPEVSPILMLPQDAITEWKNEELERVVAVPKIKSLIKRTKAKVQTASGEVARCIIECAQKAKCHEIVMGTRGSGAVKGLLIGSVATKVAQLAEVPVTLVK